MQFKAYYFTIDAELSTSLAHSGESVTGALLGSLRTPIRLYNGIESIGEGAFAEHTAPT